MGHGGGFGGFRGGGFHGGLGSMGRFGRAGHPNLGQHLQQQQQLHRLQQEYHALQQHQMAAAQRWHQQFMQLHQQELADANQLHQLKLTNAHLQQEVNQTNINGNTVNVNRNRNVNNGNLAAGESSISNGGGANGAYALSYLLPLLYTLPMMMGRGGFGGGGYGGMGGGYNNPWGGGYNNPWGGGFAPFANWNNPGGRWNNRFPPGGQPNIQQLQQMEQMQQMFALAELNDLRNWAQQGWIIVPPNSPLYGLVYPGQRGQRGPTPDTRVVPPPPLPGDPGAAPPAQLLEPASPGYVPLQPGSYNLTYLDSQPYIDNTAYGSPSYAYTNSRMCGYQRGPLAGIRRAVRNLFY